MIVAALALLFNVRQLYDLKQFLKIKTLMEWTMVI